MRCIAIEVLGGLRRLPTRPGLGDRRHGLGVAAADMDNDGDQDLYVNNDGPNVLYRNEGNGRFRDVTEEAGVANGNRVGAAVCWLDVDRDGRLDLFVSNYIVHTPGRVGADDDAGHFGLPVTPGLRTGDEFTLSKSR